MTFGELLKSLRQEKSWSQEELAHKAGITKMGISKLETGKTNLPHASTIRNLEKAFRLKAGFFLPFILQDYASKYGNFRVEIKTG